MYSIIAGLRILNTMAVNLICRRQINMYISFKACLDSYFYTLNTCHCWPLLWWYDEDKVGSMSSFLCQSFNLSHMKLVHASDIILHGNQYSVNIIWQCVDIPYADYKEFAVIIYSTKEMAVIKGKYVRAYCLLPLSWNSMFFRLYLLNLTFLAAYHIFFNVPIHILAVQKVLCQQHCLFYARHYYGVTPTPQPAVALAL